MSHGWQSNSKQDTQFEEREVAIHTCTEPFCHKFLMVPNSTKVTLPY